MSKIRCAACNEELEPLFHRNDGKPVYKFINEKPVCADPDCEEEIADEFYPIMRVEYEEYMVEEEFEVQDCHFFEWIEESEYIILRVPGYFEDEYVEAF